MLAPTGPPFGFWLKKLCVWLLRFLSCVLDKFSIHTGLVISVYISVSVGFRFRLVRYSEKVLSSRDATANVLPRTNPVFAAFSRENCFQKICRAPMKAIQQIHLRPEKGTVVCQKRDGQNNAKPVLGETSRLFARPRAVARLRADRVIP